MAAFQTIDAPAKGRGSWRGIDKTAVVDMVKLGHTLAAVGRQFGVTRERVRRIAIEHGIRRQVLRHAQALELLAPFIAALPVKHTCLLCSNSVAQDMLCSECYRVFRALKNLAHRLEHLTPRNRTQAVWLIRHYGFTPEDLKFIGRNEPCR